MAKGAIDKAEQALNENKNEGTNNPTTIVTTNGNLSEATDVIKSTDQLVDHGGKQRLSNTIETYGESGLRIKHHLAQEAKTEIDRAWMGLGNKSGNIVTKMESADNLKSDSGPISPDTAQLSNIPSSDIGSTNSNLNSKIDNLATENKLRVSPSQAGKSDVRSTSSAIISQDSHSAGKKIEPKADAGKNQEVIAGAMVTLDGTNSKIGDNSGRLSYSWKQIGGPKVMIVDANTAIASFEAPKVSSAGDKLTLKFVPLIADGSDISGRNNDKDSVTIMVKQDTFADPESGFTVFIQ